MIDRPDLKAGGGSTPVRRPALTAQGDGKGQTGEDLDLRSHDVLRDETPVSGPSMVLYVGVSTYKRLEAEPKSTAWRWKPLLPL